VTITNNRNRNQLLLKYITTRKDTTLLNNSNWTVLCWGVLCMQDAPQIQCRLLQVVDNCI